MARIRTIKPEFWHDEKLAPCDALTRLVFLGLISAADDFGRVLDNERVLDAFMFPETSDSVREPLANLSRMGRVQRGKTASGQRIIQIVNWERHQKVDKPQPKMAFPEIVELLEVAPVRESFANHSRINREPLAPHTTDPDLHTTEQDLGAPRDRVAPKKPKAEPKHPHFVEPYKSQVFEAWKKLGSFNGGRIVNAIGPCFRPPEDPGYIAPQWLVMGVGDYCALVTQGKGSPFVGPEDCAKRLVTLARNCERLDHFDPVARVDANYMAIHGHRMPGSGAA